MKPEFPTTPPHLCLDPNPPAIINIMYESLVLLIAVD